MKNREFVASVASRIATQRTLVCITIGLASLASADTYRGIPIAPENRCTPYDRSDYPYPNRSNNALWRLWARFTGLIRALASPTQDRPTSSIWWRRRKPTTAAFARPAGQ